jgi:hypothetical protein
MSKSRTERFWLTDPPSQPTPVSHVHYDLLQACSHEPAVRITTDHARNEYLQILFGAADPLFGMELTSYGTQIQDDPSC